MWDRKVTNISDLPEEAREVFKVMCLVDGIASIKLAQFTSRPEPSPRCHVKLFASKQPDQVDGHIFHNGTVGSKQAFRVKVHSKDRRDAILGANCTSKMKRRNMMRSSAFGNEIHLRPCKWPRFVSALEQRNIIPSRTSATNRCDIRAYNHALDLGRFYACLRALSADWKHLEYTNISRFAVGCTCGTLVVIAWAHRNTKKKLDEVLAAVNSVTKANESQIAALDRITHSIELLSTAQDEQLTAIAAVSSAADRLRDEQIVLQETVGNILTSSNILTGVDQSMALIHTAQAEQLSAIAVVSDRVEVLAEGQGGITSTVNEVRESLRNDACSVRSACRVGRAPRTNISAQLLTAVNKLPQDLRPIPLLAETLDRGYVY